VAVKGRGEKKQEIATGKELGRLAQPMIELRSTK